MSGQPLRLFAATRRTGWRPLGLLLLGASAMCSASAQPVAVVLNKVGPITIDLGASARPVASLDVLSVGTRLTLENSAMLVLLTMQSGNMYVVTGPATLAIEREEPSVLSGTAAVKLAAPVGKEIRLRPDRVALGGIVLRSARPPGDRAASGAGAPLGEIEAAESPADAKLKLEVEERRPPPGSPSAMQVAFALWLDDVGLTAKARPLWRALSQEHPDDVALARRAR